MANPLDRLWNRLGIQIFNIPQMKESAMTEVEEREIPLPDEIKQQLHQCELYIVKEHPERPDAKDYGFMFLKEPSHREVEVLVLGLFEEYEDNEEIVEKIIDFFKSTKIKITLHLVQRQDIEFFEQRCFRRTGQLEGMVKLVHQRN